MVLGFKQKLKDTKEEANHIRREKKSERPATGKASPLFPCRGSDATMENNNAAVQRRKKRQDLPNIHSISSHLNQRTTTN